jgi:membrane protein required for colicin V production
MVSAHEPWNKFVAMLIIYAAASLVIWMLFRVVSGVIDRVKLNEFDRQMGALVGFAKGVLLCIAITFFAVTLLGQQQRDRIIASRSGQYIVRFLDKADAVAPPEIHQVIGPYIQKINERLDPNYQPNPAGDLQNLQEMWQQQAGGGSATTGGGWPPAASASPTWPSTADGSARPAGPAQAWPNTNGGQRR